MMAWSFWIAGACITASILMGMIKCCEEKKNLHTRIAILETKVSIILDERNKMSYRRNEEK